MPEKNALNYTNFSTPERLKKRPSYIYDGSFTAKFMRYRRDAVTGMHATMLCEYDIVTMTSTEMYV